VAQLSCTIDHVINWYYIVVAPMMLWHHHQRCQRALQHADGTRTWFSMIFDDDYLRTPWFSMIFNVFLVFLIFSYFLVGVLSFTRSTQHNTTHTTHIQHIHLSLSLARLCALYRFAVSQPHFVVVVIACRAPLVHQSAQHHCVAVVFLVDLIARFHVPAHDQSLHVLPHLPYLSENIAPLVLRLPQLLEHCLQTVSRSVWFPVVANHCQPQLAVPSLSPWVSVQTLQASHISSRTNRCHYHSVQWARHLFSCSAQRLSDSLVLIDRRVIAIGQSVARFATSTTASSTISAASALLPRLFAILLTFVIAILNAQTKETLGVCQLVIGIGIGIIAGHSQRQHLLHCKWSSNAHDRQ
jgi:hypothetical protein